MELTEDELRQNTAKTCLHLIETFYYLTNTNLFAFRVDIT